MSGIRPNVICISGFDPSGGAGILADIKTIEMHRAQGLGVCTALTFQNEKTFSGMEWVDESVVMKQLDALLKASHPKAAKIGIIENLELSAKIIDKLKTVFPQVKIVWDPVFKASAGFDFHTSFDNSLFYAILEKINLLTPNILESEMLFGTANPDEIAQKSGCSVLLKGGHSDSRMATDFFIGNGEIIKFQHERKIGFSKHGTGCILSSAIAANLALGTELPEACKRGKDYIQDILTSNPTQLAYHYE